MTNLKEQKQELMEILNGEVHEEHLRLIDFLIKSDDDLSSFHRNYFKIEAGNLTQAIHQFRINKRNASNMTEEQFMHLFATNKQQALEKLLQQPINHIELEALRKANISLSDLYTKTVNHPEYTLLPLLKSWDLLDKESKEPETIEEKLMI
ncbi:hypothetical protein MUN88_17275 [Gracilibacillus caseinilyticus]|uniref:Uncharacterized protein n=1 Tax=Gracilibacillus caseinilyticus TaxID=2932256 RepID=A0ABY4ETN4_9BACI|nr:hypothetical protein [Gracilibacillus caseinilyticus]UOQ47784.1 hypothetical protein MUN88_17275 [Gracilibacillus caseinilyticus]